MDVLTLDLGRSASTPGAPREAALDGEPRRRRLVAIPPWLRRGSAPGGGGEAIVTRRNGLVAFTATTIVMGVGLLALTSLTSSPWATIDPGIGPGTVLSGPTGGLLLWLLYGLIGSLRVLRAPGGATLTFHLPFVGAATILGGPTAGAWVAFVGTLERRELESLPWYGILANHASVVIGAVAAGVAAQIVTAVVPAGAGGAAPLAAAVVAALVLATVSTALGAATVLLREDLSVRALADILVGQVGRITALECALVVVLALAYLEVGWWAPLLVAGFVLLVWDNHPMPTPDSLTGLPRRDGFDRRLDAGVGRLRRGVTPGATLIGIDLDGFGPINNAHGHGVGDEVLAEVGRRLAAQGRRPDDVVGRLGGDEFGLFLPGLDDPDTAVRRALEIHAALAIPIVTSAGVVSVGASIGVLVVKGWGGLPSASTLQAHADSAMYHAKRTGGGVHLYDPLEPSSIGPA